MKKLTIDEFIRRAINVHGNKYDYSKVNIVNTRTKISLICYVHGEFKQSIYKHLRGSGCSKCNHVDMKTINRHRMTTNEFIEKARLIHGDKYDYSKLIYLGNKTQAIFICSKHGEFLQRPNDHLSGNGCKKCQYKKISKENIFTNEIFIEKARQIHNDKFDYSLVKYDGYENKIIIICNKHGEFKQTPHAHLQGAGCPSCSESRGEKKVGEILLKNNIKFEKEKTFPDLKDKSNLFYDFYLPEHKVFIEYHGKQHSIPIDFFGGKESLREIRRRDMIKLKYAIDNKYLLISINYVPIKNMDEVLTNALIYKSIV